jgi:hypothetical protein
MPLTRSLPPTFVLYPSGHRFSFNFHILLYLTGSPTLLKNLRLGHLSLPQRRDGMKKALDAHAEAVRIHRRLSKGVPILIRGLCASLTALGVALRAVGCPEDALRTNEEVIQLCRGPAANDLNVPKDVYVASVYL